MTQTIGGRRAARTGTVPASRATGTNRTTLLTAPHVAAVDLFLTYDAIAAESKTVADGPAAPNANIRATRRSLGDMQFVHLLEVIPAESPHASRRAQNFSMSSIA